MLSHSLGQNGGFNHVQNVCFQFYMVRRIITGDREVMCLFHFLLHKGKEKLAQNITHTLRPATQGCRGVFSRGDILKRRVLASLGAEYWGVRETRAQFSAHHTGVQCVSPLVSDLSPLFIFECDFECQRIHSQAQVLNPLSDNSLHRSTRCHRHSGPFCFL